MRKRKKKANSPRFENVTINMSLSGHGIEYCKPDDPRASIIYVDRQGKPTSAVRRISDVYGLEIRHAHRMTGACRELLHSTTVECAVGAEPEVPANALFIAKAFELAA